MEIVKKSKEYFLGFLEDDYTQLGFLTAFIKDAAPDLTDNSFVEVTKRVIQEMIKENNIYVVNEKTESRIDMSVEEIMVEIDSVFFETKGKPSIGDGIWFGIDSP